VLLGYDVYDREVKYRSTIPENETTGIKNISGEILYQYGGMNITQTTGGDTQMTVPLVPGDTNGDGTVGDFELLTYISRWVDEEVSDFDLLAAIDSWASG